MSQTYVLTANHPGRAAVLANAREFLSRLPESKSWQIDVKQYRKSRSDPQNHALFGVAYPALEESTGFTKDELHTAFCRRFFGTVEAVVMGETISRPFRTTTTDENGDRDVMPAADFARFYDAVQQMGAEIGVDVPSPDAMHTQRERFA